MSDRTDRLDQLLREEISGIIAREVADPRIGFVTVTSVDVAPDLVHATVWVSVIGDEQQRRASLRTLGRAMPFVRHRLGQLRLRRVPELHLRHDDSSERGTRVLRLIDELEAEGPGSTAEPATLEALPTPRTQRGEPEPVAPSAPRPPRQRRPAGDASRGRSGAPDRRRGRGR